jgi:hypothetical protein
MSEEIVVYTASIAPKTQRPHQGNVKDGCRFVVFMDEDRKTGQWERLPADTTQNTGRRRSRIHKILPFRYFDEEVSIWLDSTFGLAVSPRDLVRVALEVADFAVFEHPQKDCLYKEAQRVLKTHRHDPGEESVIRDQMARYREDGFPGDRGLAMGGVLIRRHTPEVIRVCEMWWDEMCRGSSRDQLSFEYCCWKTGCNVHRMSRARSHPMWSQLSDGKSPILLSSNRRIALP